MLKKTLLSISIFLTLHICVLHAQNAETYLKQGIQLYQLGQFQQATESLDKALSINPKLGEAYFYRASSYLYLRDFKKTKKDLDLANKYLKNNENVLLHYGYLYNETGQYEKALKSFTKVLSIKPNLASAYNARGFSNQRLGDLRAALADYSSAIKADSSFALAYNNRGSAIYYNQDVAEPSKQDIRLAIKDFSSALAIQPDFCLARRNKGLAYSFLEQYDTAITELSLAIDCEPQNALNYLLRGIVKSKSQNYTEALNDFTKALEQKPGYADAYLEMGFAKAYLGFTSEAVSDFENAIQLNDRLSAIAWYGMAVAHAQNKDKDAMLLKLESVKKTGFFKDKKNMNRLAKEKAFSEYKNDKDYKAFLQKLK
jgi:tetratricopeptide (TPR) repeat protein